MLNNRIQFEGYIKSYLNNYLERKKNKEDFEIGFYEYLLNQIFNVAGRTILTLLYTFKKENLLQGNTSEERYTYFDNYSKTDDFHKLVDKLYPLLTLRLDRIINNHIVNYNKLKERVEKDKIELFHKFGLEINSIEDCHIKYGVSDAHRGLNSICIIENNSKKIVYKPRSGRIDTNWGFFIDWFNSKNPSLKLSINKIIDKGDYYWQEYVYNNPCESELEIKELYYRIGLLSSISYVLRIEDLHMENIIVNREFPYLVDLETIFQLDAFQNGDLKLKSVTDVLNKKVRQSILSTQLFPTPSKFQDSNVDISGITGRIYILFQDN
ncbi:DUF4135 domain-containing protein [Tissierella praeacuta]|uniref:DUF4135 domain-containing protein n=1 Tax=Tissierella praeacuta TaxID=43131 RepID=UPI001053E5D8|nr:DUF4135 domain-containing protein [Tissierella praeacuta]TCU67830.1 uncharacterized protein DUF4135 [Tissierella praeacuta]